MKLLEKPVSEKAYGNQDYFLKFHQNKFSMRMFWRRSIIAWTVHDSVEMNSMNLYDLDSWTDSGIKTSFYLYSK